MIDKFEEVIPGQGDVMVDTAICGFGSRPDIPPEISGNDVVVGAAFELGFDGFIRLEAVEIFEKQNPGGLFGVVELTRTSSILPKDIINIFKDLFEHPTLRFPGLDGLTSNHPISSICDYHSRDSVG